MNVNIKWIIKKWNYQESKYFVKILEVIDALKQKLKYEQTFNFESCRMPGTIYHICMYEGWIQLSDFWWGNCI